MTVTKNQSCKIRTVNPNIDGGWAWVVLVSSFCSFAVMSALFYTFGLYYIIFLEEFHQTRSTTAWVGSLNGALFQISGPLGSAVVVKFGCRAAVIIGGLICTSGYLMSGFSGHLWHLFITYGLIIAVGHSMVYTGFIVVLGHYFQRRHALVMGLSMAGVGCGLFALGPVIQYIIDEFGWRGSFVTNAGLTIHFLVAGSLLFPLSKKSLPATHDEIGLMGSQVLIKSEDNSTESAWDPKLVSDAKFWLLNIGGFFCVMGSLTVFVILKDFAMTRQLGESFALALIALGIGDIVGRILTGVIAGNRKINLMIYYGLIMTACGLIILGYMAVNSVISLIILSVLFGFFFGQQSVLLPIVVVAFYGPQKLTIIFGFLMFTAGIGNLIGPPLAGCIVDETKSFEGAFIFSGICNFVAGMCMFIMYFINRYLSLKTPRPEKNETELTALQNVSLDKHEGNGVGVHE